ncbi:hypothetical protein SAMN02745146_3421 [Hymenobacter daecheongensis DSM 21074]|uniref:Uncharacterized protein n=1 Tax=Hymenobacter daecheongensis DSM 21074 TaxID=1121955 RepID=A0A1M6KG10_9BACT|nr:hypothetical protein [Hymenobacter daecheongensis]SHJ57827.1 hypothetical protein SAMN02745146_3421 [Hymenobacter daecheongensis DSM 21074]
MPNRSFFLLMLLLAGFTPGFAQQTKVTKPARIAPPAASFFTTYAYLTYAIVDRQTKATPIPARGVGGTLTLHPDGTFQKRLTLQGNGGTLHFDQDGRFSFSGTQITFTYTDSKGQPRVDQGTFRLQPAVGLLTLTLVGFPAGNQGIYTLRAQ